MVAIFAISTLLTGCEYAIPVSISRHARHLQATLGPETASGILQGYLAGSKDHRGLIGYEYKTIGDRWLWIAAGTPLNASIKDGLLVFEADPATDFKRVQRFAKSGYFGNENRPPAWFESSRFEINLATLRGVVFWDPVHSSTIAPRGRLVELQWRDPDVTDARPRETRRGTLTLHVQIGNTDDLIAALKYFAPNATFTAAR